MVYQGQITVETSGHRDMHDLTGEVEHIVRQSGTPTGLVHLSNVGSTAAIGIIQFEPGLREDLPEILERPILRGRSCAHKQAWHDSSGRSHLRETRLEPSP